MAVINDNLKLAIIAYAKARPSIWINVTQDNRQGDAAWKSLSDGFSLSVLEIKKSWMEMRETYFKLLKEYLMTGVEPSWVCFSKMDEFLRTPTLRAWEKDSVSLLGPNKDIECIDLSSDSDGESGTPVATLPSQLPPHEDRNEHRKTVIKSSEASKKKSDVTPASTSRNQPPRNCPQSTGLELERKRNPIPSIADVKRRLTESCGEVIALKKLDQNDVLSRSLPVDKAVVIAPPKKTFRSNPKLASKPKLDSSFPQRKPVPKKKQVLDKSNSKPKKKRGPDLVPNLGSPNPVRGECGSNSTGSDTNKPSEGEKLALPCDTIIMRCLRASSNEGNATLPSNSTTSGNCVHQVPSGSLETLPKGPRKSQKTPRNPKKDKDKPVQSEPPVLIQLDNSDEEDSPAGSNDPGKKCDPPTQKNDVEPEAAKPEQVEAKNLVNLDIWKKWEAEVAELPKLEEGRDCDPDEAEMKVRKDFLLSFLPDMAEMSVKQRRFFKSKLLFLVSNIDQFS